MYSVILTGYLGQRQAMCYGPLQSALNERKPADPISNIYSLQALSDAEQAGFEAANVTLQGAGIVCCRVGSWSDSARVGVNMLR